MASDKVSVTFKCKKCGGDTLEVPDESADNSIVTCTSCGIEVGRWGDIKNAAVETVKESVVKDVKDMLRNAVKGNKHIQFK